MYGDEKKTFTEEELDRLYEKAELDLLRDALRRTPSERFTMMMTLIKAGKMLRNAKIIRSPILPKSSGDGNH